MKEETLKKVEETTANWAYMKELPDSIRTFELRRLNLVHGDVYDLFAYTNEASHKSVIAYYHEETDEYKLRVQIGSFEFCLKEFIVSKLEDFEPALRSRLDGVLLDMMEFNSEHADMVFIDKHILEWSFAKTLPERLEEFELFIRPSNPFRITNGSYIVLDYEHFASKSNFALYYNVFRDEFFSDERIAAVPDTDYEFDARTLDELEDKITLRLAPRLKKIRELAQSKISS